MLGPPSPSQTHKPTLIIMQAISMKNLPSLKYLLNQKKHKGKDNRNTNYQHLSNCLSTEFRAAVMFPHADTYIEKPGHDVHCLCPLNTNFSFKKVNEMKICTSNVE